jgi:uncharacterized protein (DUF1330 family)
MTDDRAMAGGLTLAFVGFARETAARARAYEDAVLALLPDHGARVLFRGHRAPGEDRGLPAEVHILWFPDRIRFDSFLADPRRAELLASHGQVFDDTVVVELEPR